VLVIIGLIVGGVLAGRDLIGMARVRQVITDVEGYKMSVSVYQDRYSWLPGDDPQAYIRWGSACGVNSGSAVNGCNGNGDGDLGGGNEVRRIWKHLELAEIGDFSPGAPVYNAALVAGENIPKSSIKGSGYAFHGTSPTCNRAGGQVPTWLVMGEATSGGGLYKAGINITNAVTIPIDIKTDDGRADTGNVCSAWGWSTPSNYPGCLRGTLPYDYNKASEDGTCLMLFDIGLPVPE